MKPISQQPNDEYLLYFKLTLFDQFIFFKVKFPVKNPADAKFTFLS